MVGARSGNIEPASSPQLPDRAKREQQESPRLEPGITNPQQKMTVYSDSPFDGNINPADSIGLKLFLTATKGPDSKERITLGPETAILFLQLVRSLLSLYGWAILIGLIPDSNADKTEHAPTAELSQGRRRPSASNFVLGRRNEQHDIYTF